MLSEGTARISERELDQLKAAAAGIMLQCVAVCCVVEFRIMCFRVLYHVAVCCIVLQCVAVSERELGQLKRLLQVSCCVMLQCVVVCCVAVCCSVLRCSLLQSVAVCCSVYINL